MGSRVGLAIIALLVLSVMPMVVSADSDGDGISDATDDCIWSWAPQLLIELDA